MLGTKAFSCELLTKNGILSGGGKFTKISTKNKKLIPIFLVKNSHEIPFAPKFFLIHIKIIWGQFEGGI